MNRNRMLAAGTAVVLVAAVGVTGTVGNVSFPNNIAVVSAKEASNNKTVQTLKSVIEQSSGISASNAEGIFKDESVYVLAKEDGTAKSAKVTEWLKNAGDSKTLSDYTELKKVENVKSDEKFKQSGKDLTWNTKGQDIFYQGTTKKELPVEVKIEYLLDGKPISPKKLKGKSGKLEMKISYTNKEKQKVEINGKEEEIYTPFTMVTGMMLPEEHFSRVTIDHGKVISDASNQIVVGMAFPGLQESLGLQDNEDVKLSDGLTITADVKDFKMGPTLTVATTEVMEQFRLEDVSSFDELKDSLDELGSASKQLTDGSKTLSDGLNELQSKTGTLISGLDTFSLGTKDLSDGAAALKEGISSYTKGADTLSTGVSQYVDGAGKLSDGVTEYVQKTGALASGIGEVADNLPALSAGSGSVKQGVSDVSSTLSALEGLAANISDSDPYKAQLLGTIQALKNSVDTKLVPGTAQVAGGLDLMNQKVQQSKEQLTALPDAQNKLLTGAAELKNKGRELSTGANQLSKESSNLKAGAGKVSDGALKLQSGGKELVTGSSAMSDGIGKLAAGGTELKDSMEKFDSEGIQKLSDTFHGDIQVLLDRLNAMRDLADSYKSFAGIKEDMPGSVKFIIETKEI